jgi:hypothetical protein
VRLSDARATRTIVAAILHGRSFNRVQQAFLSGITNRGSGSMGTALETVHLKPRGSRGPSK